MVRSREKASFSTSGSPSQTVPVNVTVMFCGILFCACTGMTKKIHPWNARLAISSACGFGVSYQVNSVPIAVNPTRGFNSYFPMPFRKNARITIENQCDEPIPAFFYQIDYCLTTVPEDAAYFHAQWRRQRITEKAKDYVVLDNIKGKGQYVGTYLALTSLERYWYGEGEMKFYIDGDKDYPTICGTGTEDYFGGAWSFATQQNGQTVENQYCTPYLGYPYYSTHDTFLHNDYHNDDQMPQRSFYRCTFFDPNPF